MLTRVDGYAGLLDSQFGLLTRRPTATHSPLRVQTEGARYSVPRGLDVRSVDSRDLSDFLVWSEQ